jgi:hypothetical protein
VEEVQELICAMREDTGFRPDTVTYGGHGGVDEALEVYRHLEKGEEAGVVPGCSTYTFVVGMLCGVGWWFEAEDVFYEGVKCLKVIDLGTIHELVHGLKDTGKGHTARHVVVGLCKKFLDQFDGRGRSSRR